MLREWWLGKSQLIASLPEHHRELLLMREGAAFRGGVAIGILGMTVAFIALLLWLGVPNA